MNTKTFIRRPLLRLLSTMVFLAGCSKQNEPDAHGEADGHGHAAAKAHVETKDGVSMCSEHGVPEAECGICKPHLATTLKPGETQRMPVIFFVDPKNMDDPDAPDVETITLSYTFYPADAGKTPGRAQTQSES